MSTESGYLYCMTNSAFPDFVKVGFTLKNPVEKAEELSNGSVPLPFVVEFAKLVVAPNEKEKTVHKHLEKYSERVNPVKDFFKIEKDRVSDFFDLMDGEVWTAAPLVPVDAWKTLIDKVFELLKKEYPKWSLVNLGQAKMRVASAIKAKYGVTTNPTAEQVKEAMSNDPVTTIPV